MTSALFEGEQKTYTSTPTSHTGNLKNLEVEVDLVHVWFLDSISSLASCTYPHGLAHSGHFIRFLALLYSRITLSQCPLADAKLLNAESKLLCGTTMVVNILPEMFQTKACIMHSSTGFHAKASFQRPTYRINFPTQCISRLRASQCISEKENLTQGSTSLPPSNRCIEFVTTTVHCTHTRFKTPTLPECV